LPAHLHQPGHVALPADLCQVELGRHEAVRGDHVASGAVEILAVRGHHGLRRGIVEERAGQEVQLLELHPQRRGGALLQQVAHAAVQDCDRHRSDEQG
jgi:hypothetical protein